MIRKLSRLITMTILAALVLSLGFGAFAADTDSAFTIYTINGYNAPVAGAVFSLYGPDGSAVASATTGGTGYATMTIPASAIADEGTTNFNLVQTGVPSGYEVTDNNWAVTVTMVDGVAAVDVAADGLWDTMFDWIDGTVVTGAEYAGGTLTVANIAQYYDIPQCTKTVVGLSYTQMQGYISDFELADASGRVVASGHAIGFAVQGDESFKAPIVFDSVKLPAGTYTLRETSVTGIEDMDFEGSKLLNNGAIVVGANGSGETVYAEYAVPVVYVPPVENNDTPQTPPTNNSDDSTLDNNAVETNTSDETETPVKDDEDKKDSEEVGEVEIDDEAVPTAANPENSGIKVWIIVVFACVVLAVTVFILKRQKTNE